MTTTAPTTAPLTAANVDAGALKKALAKIKPAVAKTSGSLQVLKGVRIDGHGDYVTVTATDMDLTLTARVEGSGTGSAIVPFATLTKFVQKAKDGVVLDTGTYDDEGNPADELDLFTGRVKVSVRTLPVDDWPFEPKIDDPDVVQLDLDALGEAAIAASTDESRPILTGVLVDGHEIVGTDSYRLFIIRSPRNAMIGESMLVPARACALLGKLGGVVGGVRNERFLQVTVDDLTVTVRLIDGQFPNYKGLVPNTDEVAVTFGPAFLPAVKDVAAMFGAVTAGDRWDASPLRIERAGEWNLGDAATVLNDKVGIRLAMKSRDMGATEAIVPGVVHLETGIAFNPQYLASCLEGYEFTEIIGIDALKPGKFVHVDDEGREHIRLLMPVRV
jgi:DNA polymerase-3 subunit beta